MKREVNKSEKPSSTLQNFRSKLKPFLPALPFLLLLLISIFLLRPLYHPWFPRVTDGEYYLARLGNFFVALEHGQIIPRWAPTFKFGFGYPVFNFNYPLPNYLGAFFMALGFTAQTSMKFIFGLSLIGAGFGAYTFLRSHFKTLPSFVGAFLYITAPYFTYDMFLRGTYGELVAFAIFPFTLLLTEKYLNRNSKQNFIGFVLLSVLLLLSHNIMAVFSVVTIFFYLLINYRLNHLKSLIYPFFLSILLVSFFWIPALFETKYTVMTERSLYQSFLIKLKPFSEITKLPPFFPQKPSLEQMRQIGYAQIITIVFSLVHLVKSKTKSKFAFVFLISAIFSFFMTIKPSEVVWKIFPAANIFQHPFRLLFITTISTSFLGAYIVSVTKSKIIPVVLITLTICTYYLYYTLPTDYVLYEDNFLKNYPLTSTAADEFDPPWYEKTVSDKFLDGSTDHYLIATGSAVIHDTSEDYLNKNLNIYVEKPVEIVEKTLYFPGWGVEIDNHKIDIDSTKYKYGGLINYTVPEGSHIVTTRFTENTPARIIGNSLTLLGIFLFAIKTIPTNKKSK